MNKWIWIGLGIAALGAFLFWLFMGSAKSLPGEKVADLGREHMAIGTEVSYNSNPPTSGKHYEDWIKAGVYQTAKDDRNLVHSLEHGYVIMSYNCDYKGIGYSIQSTVYAHGLEEEEASPSSDGATDSAELSEDCHELVDQLISVYQKKGRIRLIVVPRPNLDSKIALTAWGRIDKFNPSTSSGLSASEIESIEKFIDAYLNQGPEKTKESAGQLNEQ
ncbi:hypothetical protein A3B45_00740 [Candidatus Daviesbacteria bacterium RIFCSPLOWO2_01_FULL_39_12]|uniref:DUF3105 domain-containing protein n=1 Tax=Candidatus Daviesbacteria bacterium RIFCSPLOWO2_01_FULL_39_12 TaxID=1797785 RepID=A0A1F5KR01_9BACT|nr:MAG: hypothetical protein A3B45_00740 [Candidatus Daviesbacteria bacterium RIFCSPLOWO2_01_FULL_39_12]